MSKKKTGLEKWSCDFETTTDINDCRVWAWCSIDINDNNRILYGNSIVSFIEWAKQYDKICYFHNEKFDGEFILAYLMVNGFTLNTQVRYLQPLQLNTLISNKGQFYSLVVKFENNVKVTFYDSLKLLPFKVKKIAKDFKLPISKLEIDYIETRPIGHELTTLEKEYITNDALIIAMALKFLFDQGFNKITTGSNAFSFYKKQLGGEKAFRKLFPIPENDDYVRKSYRGGWTFANPLFVGRNDITAGIVLDVNSLYPFVLHSPFKYPCGEPAYYEGEYIADKSYPLFIQRFKCSFELKHGYLPTIQIKGHQYGFSPTEYLTSSKDIEATLTLTSVDLKLFLEHYDTYNMTFIDGYKYREAVGLFDEYINHWVNEKIQSEKDGNPSMRQIAKLMLNSLYGKFATNPNVSSKWPEIDDTGTLHYVEGGEEQKTPIYIAVGVFCTSYARNVTITAAQKNYSRFIYADTDSLHLLGLELPKELDIDKYRLGAWKNEAVFDKAKYLRSKMYMEHLREPTEPPGSETWKVTGAGMPDETKKYVTFDNFEIGSEYLGKLRPVHVPGGIVLVDTLFTIRK